MATTSILGKSISELNDHEAFELVKRLRTSRRTSKKAMAVKTKKTASTISAKSRASRSKVVPANPLDLLKSLGEADRLKLLSELEGLL